MARMPRRLFRGPTIQAALVLGFAATFGVWLFAGIQFARRMFERSGQKAYDLVSVLRRWLRA